MSTCFTNCSCWRILEFWLPRQKHLWVSPPPTHPPSGFNSIIKAPVAAPSSAETFCGGGGGSPPETWTSGCSNLTWAAGGSFHVTSVLKKGHLSHGRPPTGWSLLFPALAEPRGSLWPQIKASKSSQCATPHLFQLLETSRDHTTSQCWTPELELLYNFKFTENIDLKKWVNKDCVILIECESFLGHQQAMNKELLGPGLLLQLFQPWMKERLLLLVDKDGCSACWWEYTEKVQEPIRAGTSQGWLKQTLQPGSTVSSLCPRREAGQKNSQPTTSQTKVRLQKQDVNFIHHKFVDQTVRLVIVHPE